MDKIDSNSLDLTKLNIEKIKQIFPEIVIDGKIDFEKLKLLLGEEIETKNERYAFTWNGKTQTISNSLKPSTATLIPVKEKSEDWDNTNNLYIEGDNLEVLKILQKTYHNKVKMIFIDPPYNTGTDFIYEDNFTDSIENYKNITGQSNRANPEYNGRYHTDWLNMMYSRLKLAHSLLSDDGAIFVSIDYNEFANLKKIMDEIFGENNFQREIIWRIGWLSGYKTTAPNFIRNHDTILFYSKNADNLNFIKKYIENKDFKPLVKKEPKLSSKLSGFGLNEKQQQELLNFINYENRPERYPIEDTWNCNEYDDLNSIAIVSFSGEKISKILEIDQDFKGQKSIKMLMRLLEATTEKDDIVMDFFSGTSSTAHAVMELNKKDGGNRKFIMVQLPEKCNENEAAYQNGYMTICDIAEERIRRCGKKIKNEIINKYENAGLFADNVINPNCFDIGFKVFRLESTNIKPWDGENIVDETTIFDFTDTIKEGRSNLDVAYEIMLKYGIFNMPLKEVNINNKTMYNIGEGYMIICLDNDITSKDVMEISNLKPHCVVFKEQGFADDNEKINATYTLERLGVEDVKCI